MSVPQRESTAESGQDDSRFSVRERAFGLATDEVASIVSNDSSLQARLLDNDGNCDPASNPAVTGQQVPGGKFVGVEMLI